MTTYTLALGHSLLLATVPDGGDVSEQIAEEERKAGGDSLEYECISGCTLTDDKPEDTDTIVWHSGNEGWIIDETGRDWKYAVRA